MLEDKQESPFASYGMKVCRLLSMNFKKFKPYRVLIHSTLHRVTYLFPVNFLFVRIPANAYVLRLPFRNWVSFRNKGGPKVVFPFENSLLPSLLEHIKENGQSFEIYMTLLINMPFMLAYSYEHHKSSNYWTIAHLLFQLH